MPVFTAVLARSAVFASRHVSASKVVGGAAAVLLSTSGPRSFPSWSSSTARCASSASASGNNDSKKGYEANADKTPLVFVAEATMFPSPEKPQGDQGEDNFFVNKRSLGVFDGVGGYRDTIKDAGEYSRTLALNAGHYCRVVDEKFPGTVIDPLHAIVFGVLNTKVMGSSTAAVATIAGDGALRIRNVGDSGVMLWRKHLPPSLVPQNKLPVDQAAKLWQLEAKTKVGVHSFNFPHQLEYSEYCHNPEDGEELTLRPKQGDLVILCTDGVFDNLFDDDIRKQLAKFDLTPCTQLVRAKRRRQEEKRAAMEPDGKTKLERLKVLGVAEELFVTDTEVAEKEKECRALLRAMTTMMAMTAQRVGMDRRAITPFSEGAKAEGGAWLQFRVGGKPDDVTVIIALVCADDEVVVTPPPPQLPEDAKQQQQGSKEGNKA